MPIELYTGKPGNGKTAFMIDRMIDEAGKKDPRPLIAYGIDGLEPGLATVLTDPRRWNDIDPDGDPVCTCAETGDPDQTPRDPHAHIVPNGALVFVDEAWKWFGHLQDASRQPTPPHALALAEHRHRGLDFIWTAQGPNQIYPFVRPLIADHYHCVRRFGSQFVDVFKWGELQDDVKSASKRENSDRSTKALPKRSFGKYKSADEHTIKLKLPAKVWGLPLMVIAAAALLYFGIQMARPSSMAERMTGTATDDALAASEPTRQSIQGRGDPVKPETPAEYAERHLPRFATMPHTAPVFDERSIVSDPRVYCMASGAGQGAQGYIDASVTCFTEQGTRYSLAENDARYVARWGQPYNPYRAESQPTSGAVGGPFAQADMVSSVAIGRTPQISGYGDIGIIPNPGP